MLERLPCGSSSTRDRPPRPCCGAVMAEDCALVQYGFAGAEGFPEETIASVVRDLTLRLEGERRTHATDLTMAVLEDRERIARDLHDRVIQRLFAAGLCIEGIRERYPELSERLAHLVVELDDAIQELRLSIFQLTIRPSTHSLRTLILDVCTAEGAALGFNPVLRFHGLIDTISDSAGDQLRAVLREALSNVAHHAHATAVRVTVTVGADLVLRVEDNGIGLSDHPRHQAGNGLANMAARAHKLGGTCDLTPTGPSRTTLEWRVPQPEASLSE